MWVSLLRLHNIQLELILLGSVHLLWSLSLLFAFNGSWPPQKLDELCCDIRYICFRSWQIHLTNSPRLWGSLYAVWKAPCQCISVLLNVTWPHSLDMGDVIGCTVLGIYIFKSISNIQWSNELCWVLSLHNVQLSDFYHWICKTEIIF